MNKGIDTVRYNELSLPVKIEISTPDLTGTNEYFYTATGTKLHVAHQWEEHIAGFNDGVSAKATIDYCGNKIYENGELTKILVDNGYIDMTDGQYYRYVKDHLGNIRAVQGNNGVAIQSTQYYPYGMSYQDRVFGQEQQPYLFNGKELDNISGLNWYDFSARYYDDVLGRFTTPDPMAEMYYSISPYAAFGDSPLRFVDPSGMRALDFQNEDWVESASGQIYWDENATSQATTKEGEKYLGKNVLVGTHNRDENLNEPINSATFELYLESDKTGPTATINGNTVPADVDQYGTLAEGLYPANGVMYHGDWALLIKGGGNLPTVNGNPNPENRNNWNPDGTPKPISEQIVNGVLFHKGNNYAESLRDSKGNPYSTACQTGGCYKGAHTAYRAFAKNLIGFKGSYYLRGKPSTPAPAYIPIDSSLSGIKHF